MTNRPTSVLIREVFMSLPAFTIHVNVEIVWDILTSLKNYIGVEADRKNGSVGSLLAALLCSFQILTVSAKNAFNDVEEKFFTNALFKTIARVLMKQHELEMTDYLVLMKCLTIGFMQKRQFSVVLVRVFIKRLALVALHLPMPV